MNFVLFSPAHLLTVAVVLGVSVLLPLWVRRNCSERQGIQVAVGLGIFVVAHEVVKAWIRVTVYDHRFRRCAAVSLVQHRHHGDGGPDALA